MNKEIKPSKAAIKRLNKQADDIRRQVEQMEEELDHRVHEKMVGKYYAVITNVYHRLRLSNEYGGHPVLKFFYVLEANPRSIRIGGFRKNWLTEDWFAGVYDFYLEKRWKLVEISEEEYHRLADITYNNMAAFIPGFYLRKEGENGK